VRLLLNSGDKRHLDNVTIVPCSERANRQRDIAKDKEPATPRLPDSQSDSELRRQTTKSEVCSRLGAARRHTVRLACW